MPRQADKGMASRMSWQPSLFDDITEPLTDYDTPLVGYTDIELAELVASWRLTND